MNRGICNKNLCQAEMYLKVYCLGREVDTMLISIDHAQNSRNSIKVFYSIF